MRGMIEKLLLRDAVVFGVTAECWLAYLKFRVEGMNTSAIITGVLVGLMIAICSFMLHEWGHLSGAWLSGSRFQVADRLGSIFLFRFDSDANARWQFLSMSCGGFLASALAVGMVVAFVPLDDLVGKVALSLVLLGVVATIILEFPVAWQVARGAPIPTGAAYTSDRL